MRVDSRLSSKLLLPNLKEDIIIVDLTVLSLEEQFCSSSPKEKPLILHQRAIDLHRDSIGNLFLSALRDPMYRKKHERSMINLNNNQREDLLLLEDLLLKANEEISTNNLMHRRLTQACLYDSCPHGLGFFRAD